MLEESKVKAIIDDFVYRGHLVKSTALQMKKYLGIDTESCPVCAGRLTEKHEGGYYSLWCMSVDCFFATSPLAERDYMIERLDWIREKLAGGHQ